MVKLTKYRRSSTRTVYIDCKWKRLRQSFSENSAAEDVSWNRETLKHTLFPSHILAIFLAWIFLNKSKTISHFTCLEGMCVCVCVAVTVNKKWKETYREKNLLHIFKRLVIFKWLMCINGVIKSKDMIYHIIIMVLLLSQV